MVIHKILGLSSSDISLDKPRVLSDKRSLPIGCRQKEAAFILSTWPVEMNNRNAE